MQKLSKGNYSLAKKIVVENSNPSFSSILCGIASGEVWINDVENPTLALVYSTPVGGFRILGSFESDAIFITFVNFLENELFEQIKAKGISEFEFAADNLEVEKSLVNHFNKYNIITDQELTYVKPPYDTTRKLNNFIETINYEFIEVDEKCLAHNLTNYDFILSRIIDSWGTMNSFYEHGKAFFAIDKNEIIGFILGSARYKNVLTIDIETKSKYRKKGIATALTNRLLDYCQEANITAYWNCTASNINSQDLAKETGFLYEGENNYYYFSI